MKRIGGKSVFNPETKQWESRPVSYVEFHCTPEEWSKIKGQLLVRDWVRSRNWEDERWDKDLEDIINEAVNEIISERYELRIYKDEYINHSNMGDYKLDCLVCDISNGPDIYISNVEGTIPNGDSHMYNEQMLIECVFNVVDSIFKVIERYRNGKKYLKQLTYWKEVKINS